MPELDAKGIPSRLLDLTGFLFHGLSEEQIESLQEDEFEDYRWMRQGLSKRSRPRCHSPPHGTRPPRIPGGNIIVYATVALYPLVRYGEILRGLRDLECRIASAFPGEERGGKLHFMNRRMVPTTWPSSCSRDEGLGRCTRGREPRT